MTPSICYVDTKVYVEDVLLTTESLKRSCSLPVIYKMHESVKKFRRFLLDTA